MASSGLRCSPAYFTWASSFPSGTLSVSMMKNAGWEVSWKVSAVMRGPRGVSGLLYHNPGFDHRPAHVVGFAHAVRVRADLGANLGPRGETAHSAFGPRGLRHFLFPVRLGLLLAARIDGCHRPGLVLRGAHRRRHRGCHH